MADMKELSRKVHETYGQYARLGARNVYGMSTEDRVALDAECRLAEAAYIQALDAARAEAKRQVSAQAVIDERTGKDMHDSNVQRFTESDEQ